MVKGVNKSVIEINDTGSEIFERIVFYVAPEYGNINPKNLYKEAGKYTFNFDSRATRGYKTLRQREKRRKRIITALAILGSLGLAVSLFLIF